MRRGSQVEVPSPGQNRKVAAFGAINYASGKHLSHVPNVPKGGKNAAQFLILLQQLDERARRTGIPIILALDNGSIHTAKRVQATLANLKLSRRVKVYWLPKYAPELNEQERVWKVAKEQGVANVLLRNRDSLRTHVTRVLASINAKGNQSLTVVLGRAEKKNRIRKNLGTGT